MTLLFSCPNHLCQSICEVRIMCIVMLVLNQDLSYHAGKSCRSDSQPIHFLWLLAQLIFGSYRVASFVNKRLQLLFSCKVLCLHCLIMNLQCRQRFESLSLAFYCKTSYRFPTNPTFLLKKSGGLHCSRWCVLLSFRNC